MWNSLWDRCFLQQNDKCEARAPMSRETACSYDVCNHHFCHFCAGDGESCFPCRKLLPDSKYPRTWLHVQDESPLQHCIQRFWWTASMKSLILWTEVLSYIIAIVFVIFWPKINHTSFRSKGMMFAESWITDVAITCGISQRQVSTHPPPPSSPISRKEWSVTPGLLHCNELREKTSVRTKLV